MKTMRRIKRSFSSIVAILTVFLSIPMATLAQEGNWGLGYGQAGEKPTGNDSAEKLSKYNAYYVGSGDEKVVYLTFDAGFENGYTPQILDTLKEENVPATFFVVGTYIRDNPQLIKRMEEEGHLVGNHSMTHPDMSRMSKEAFEKELKITEEQYQEVTGKEIPKLYRPPQGKYSETSLDYANQLGYKTVFWSLAYVDWNVDKQPTKQQAFDKLIPRLHPGTILLLHSTSATNGEILGDLIKEYKALGYEFKSLEELE